MQFWYTSIWGKVAYRVLGRLFQSYEMFLAVCLALYCMTLFWRWNWICMLHNLRVSWGGMGIFTFFFQKKVHPSNSPWLLWYCRIMLLDVSVTGTSNNIWIQECRVFPFVHLKCNALDVLKWLWGHQCDF